MIIPKNISGIPQKAKTLWSQKGITIPKMQRSIHKLLHRMIWHFVSWIETTFHSFSHYRAPWFDATRHWWIAHPTLCARRRNSWRSQFMSATHSIHALAQFIVESVVWDKRQSRRGSREQKVYFYAKNGGCNDKRYILIVLFYITKQFNKSIVHKYRCKYSRSQLCDSTMNCASAWIECVALMNWLRHELRLRAHKVWRAIQFILKNDA